MSKEIFKDMASLCAGLLLPTVLIAVGCAHQPVAVEVEPAPYVCERAFGSIIIDGRINDAAWQGANVITNFYAYRPKDATDLSPTEARILWDSENLYVAITCMDTDIWSYSDQADDEIWFGDASELFVKPDRDSLVYCEFVIAPNGTLYDACYPSRGAGGRHRFKTWSSGMRVITVVNGTDDDASDMDVGYTIEMAIPQSAFQGATPPADGVAWTFGIFRYDYSKRFESPLMLMSIPESEGGFHCYERYADLIFRAKGNGRGSK